MVLLNRIYTRGGDAGETSLGDGSRVAKNDVRIELVGAVDEVNTAVGVARLHTHERKALDDMLARIQNELFDLGADLSVPENVPRAAGALRIVASQTERLEAEIDAMNLDLSPLNSFILPGGTPLAAQLHVARTVARRAERLFVTLARREPVNEEAGKYLNRLSDHLFVMSRAANGGDDVLWVPGQSR